jgi:hypothetical protein
MWGAVLAVALVLFFVVCAALGRVANPVGYFVVCLVCSMFFVWSVATFTGVERIETYACAWRVDEEGFEVDLSPVGGFTWSRVESAALADRLQKEKPRFVPVDVSVVRDFGCVRARGLIQRVDGISVREPWADAGAAP